MSLACPFDFSISVCVLIAVQTHRLSYLCSTDVDTNTDTKNFKKWGYGHCGRHATCIFICLYNIVVFKKFSKFKLQNVYKTECDMPI